MLSLYDAELKLGVTMPAQLKYVSTPGKTFRKGNDMIEVRGGGVYARRDIKQSENTSVYAEFPIALVKESEVPYVIFNPKFSQREALYMCCQIILWNNDFAKTLYSRFPPKYVNPFYEAIKRPKGGVPVSPHTSPWAAIISFLTDLDVDKAIVDWWTRSDRLENLHFVISNLLFKPNTLTTCESVEYSGVWLGASQFRHCCTESANCIEVLEIVTDVDDSGDREPLAFLRLFPKRDIKAGEELTWCKFAGPDGITNDFIYRESVERITGHICHCKKCEKMHKRQRDIKLKLEMQGRKKQKAKTRNRKLVTTTTTKQQKRVTMVVGNHGALVIDPELPPGSMKLLKMDILDYIIKKGPTLVEQKNGRPPALTRDETKKIHVQSEMFYQMLTRHMDIAYERRDFRGVEHVCELVRIMFCQMDSLLTLFLRFHDNIRLFCERFLESQQQLQKTHESSWWWAAVNFDLATKFCREPRLQMASCYSGFTVEMSTIVFHPHNKDARNRAVVYFNKLCDIVEANFGYYKSLSIVPKELCKIPYVRVVDDDDDGAPLGGEGTNQVPLLPEGMNMYMFLNKQYQDFCKEHNFDYIGDTDKEAINRTLKEFEPKFYPMLVECAAILVQRRRRQKIMWTRLKEVAAKYRKQREAQKERGIQLLQAYARGKVARDEYSFLLQQHLREEQLRVIKITPYVILIQSIIRRNLAVKRLERTLNAVTTLQSLLRSLLAKKRLRTLKEDERKRRQQQEELVRLEESRRRQEEKRRREADRRRQAEEERKHRRQEEARQRQQKQELEERRRREKAERKKRIEEEAHLRQKQEEQKRIRQRQEEEEARLRCEKQEEEEQKRLEQIRQKQEEEEEKEARLRREKEGEEVVEVPLPTDRDYDRLQQEYLQAQQQLLIQQHQLALMHHQLELQRLQQDAFIPPPQHAGYYYQGVFYPPHG